MRGLVAAGVAATALAVGANAAGAGVSVGAVDDLYETPFETPVTIDPLENDVLPEFAIIDGPHFVGEPQHGTLDGLEYTPAAGFSGTDSFDYYFTWEWEQEVEALVAQQVFDPEECNIEFQCSMATVFVEVGAPPATTTTTVAPATTTTPTTVATQVVESTTTTTQVAAQAELPRTGGGTSRAWAPLGAATVLAGVAAMRFGRRQNPRRI
jgi:hypothetical protein